MRVVILGAGGQLGRAVAREFEGSGSEVRLLTRHEVDITRRDQVRVIAAWPPDVVINCAAYNNVDGAEREPDVAMAVNCHGVTVLADVANECGATLVHFSSDFVFDGDSERPYTEADRPNPLSAYGRSKAAGELAAAGAERHYILRLSSVFGGAAGEGVGGRTTIDRIIDTSLAATEVTAFLDRSVAPSYTPDVSRVTRQLMTGAAPFGVYHCGSSGWTTWADLAQEVAVMMQVPPRVRRIRMSEVQMNARRPLQCALENSRLAQVGIVLPHWRDAVRRHIAVRCGFAALAAARD